MGHSKERHDVEKTKVKKEAKTLQQNEEHRNGLVNKLSKFKFKYFFFKYTNFGPICFFTRVKILAKFISGKLEYNCTCVSVYVMWFMKS